MFAPVHTDRPDDANPDCCGPAAKLPLRIPPQLTPGRPKPVRAQSRAALASHCQTGPSPRQSQPPWKSRVALLAPPTHTVDLFLPGDCEPDVASIAGHKHKPHAPD